MFFKPTKKRIEKWAEKGKISNLDKVLSGDNIEFRNAAFEAIGKCGNLDTINLLTTYIRHPEAEVRKLAAQAMGETGEERTVEFLRKLIKDDDNEEVKEVARKAIAKINEVLAHKAEQE